MATFSSGDVTLNYEITGTGFPILLFAPGGMRSAISFWERSPWNPIEVLSPHFQVIAMDQRNAGASSAPISSSDNWQTYTNDHLALLDHLGIDQCHLMGGCIGGSYCFGMMQAAPDRVAAAIIQQTIGLDDNRAAFYDMFDGWAESLKEKRPEISQSDLTDFRSNMYDGEFLFSVDEAFVASCTTPLLILLGNDLYHPESTSRKIHELAPQSELIEDWKSPSVIEQTKATSLEFLTRHTPS